jgi:hypothetical protein
MQEPTVPVTGVARGNLGTATNLDDTQLYSLEDLHEPIADPIEADAIPVQRARATTPARPRAAARTPSLAGRRVGPIVVGALVVLGVAAALTLRDAPPTGPGGLGGGVTGAGNDAETFPPLATAAPEPTAGTDGGRGNGNGNGNGHGNGGGNGNN